MDKKKLRNVTKLYCKHWTDKQKYFYICLFLNCFSANNLISKNQSGFQPGDFCINQLLSIIHDVYV